VTDDLVMPAYVWNPVDSGQASERERHDEKKCVGEVMRNAHGRHVSETALRMFEFSGTVESHDGVEGIHPVIRVLTE